MGWCVYGPMYSHRHMHISFMCVGGDFFSGERKRVILLKLLLFLVTYRVTPQKCHPQKCFYNYVYSGLHHIWCT